VPHGLLLQVLASHGLPQRFLAAVAATLSESCIQVRVGEALSTPSRVTVGLKQGCPLSPLLFNVYLNPLLLHLERAADEAPQALAYADDVVITATSAHQLNSSLNTLGDWCR
jgi:hypothetical protein